jgi:hypothetical protein
MRTLEIQFYYVFSIRYDTVKTRQNTVQKYSIILLSSPLQQAKPKDDLDEHVVLDFYNTLKLPLSLCH